MVGKQKGRHSRKAESQTQLEIRKGDTVGKQKGRHRRKSERETQ
jgi:hypothetical protein